MRIALVCFILTVASSGLYGQERLFFNRIHYFEHQYCQHPIGTVLKDKIFFSSNTSNSVFMNFFNSESDIAYVELTHYGKYIAFNQFLKKDFISANSILMGFEQSVPNRSKSMREAKSRFKVKTVKDSIIDNKTLKHIQIIPKDTLVHRFESYNILVNTEAKTELPLFTSPSVYFLLLGSLKELKGTVVETYFIDLEGYIFCRDVLKGLQITNKRVYIK
jgi:hypothetical protein